MIQLKVIPVFPFHTAPLLVLISNSMVHLEGTPCLRLHCVALLLALSRDLAIAWNWVLPKISIILFSLNATKLMKSFLRLRFCFTKSFGYGSVTSQFKWCRGRELNSRHKDFQSFALPLSYPGKIFNYLKNQTSEILI